MEWALPIAILLSGLSLLFLRRRRRAAQSLTHIEYWVYLPEPKLPRLEAIMDRMVGNNPHNRPGRPMIGAREGMVFTDIRLHLAIGRRSNNAHVFRPDLFDAAVQPDLECMARMTGMNAIAKLRYLSEQPVEDTRSLQFMPHLADAVADLAQGVVVFDSIMDCLFTAEEFKELLAETPNMERVDRHVRVLWLAEASGGRGETRGLRKIGLPELRTDVLPEEEQTVILGALEEAVGHLWKERSLPATLDLEFLSQPFRLTFRQTRLTEAEVQIGRIVAVRDGAV